jgi:hypothetical protein
MHLLNDAHHCRSIEDGEGVGFPYMLRWWADFHRDLGVGMFPTPMASRSSQHPNKRTKSLLMTSTHWRGASCWRRRLTPS